MILLKIFRCIVTCKRMICILFSEGRGNQSVMRHYSPLLQHTNVIKSSVFFSCSFYFYFAEFASLMWSSPPPLPPLRPLHLVPPRLINVLHAVPLSASD